jgi:signal transduction histidine kinase
MRHAEHQGATGFDPSVTDRDMRLAAEAIRGPAMQLLGHAEQIPLTGEPVRRIALQLLNLSDDLQDNATFGPVERLVLEPELVVMGPLVRQVTASVSSALGGRRLWRVAPAVEPLALQVDRRALHQIMMRVLSNAARFTGEGDWIDIDARYEVDRVVISVLDEGHAVGTGTGISTDRRGLGLGLVLSRQLMEAHGGSLAVDRAPGVGTCVTLSFPRSLMVSS